MSYSLLNWINKLAPAINATNLNHMDQGIKSAHDLIDDISTGESPQGAWTPTGGAEYPLTPIVSQSWYVSNVDENGYVFLTGDLIGLTTKNMDKMLYTSAGWSLIQNNLTTSIPNGAIGNINNPLVDLVTDNSITMKQGSSSAKFSRVQANPQSTTSINRYGVMKYHDDGEPRFEKGGLLKEGVSENLCLYSQAFNNATWNSPSGVVDNAVVSPDSTTNASQFTIPAVFTSFRQDITVTAGEKYIISTWVQLGTAAQHTMGIYDVSNASFIDESIVTSATTEWSRVSHTFTAPVGCTSVRFYPIRANEASEYGTINLFGTQFEHNILSSYMPTTAGAVSRNADVLSLDFENNMPNWKDNHTIIIDYDILSLTADENRFLMTTGGLANGYINVAPVGSITYVAANGDGSSNVIPSKDNQRAAFTNDGSIIKSYFGGVKQADDGTIGVGAETNAKIYIGSLLGTSAFLFGHIKRVRIYGEDRTDNETAIA